MIYIFAVSFALGIYFSSSTNLAVILWLFLLATIFSFAFWKQKKFIKIFFAVVLAFVLGAVRMSFVETSPDPQLLKFVGQKISIEAEISKEPDIRDNSARYTVSLQNFYSDHPQKCTDIFLLENSSCSLRRASQGISDDSHSTNFDSKILVITDRFPEYKYGDEILVTGQLSLPKNFTGDNGEMFDYVSFLKKDNIQFEIYHPSIEKLGNSGNKIVSVLLTLKQKFIKNISRVVPEPNASLLSGILFGKKQSIGETLLDQFKKVSLIHIVVLSGQNLTILAVGILYLSKYFGRRKLGFTLSAITLFLFSIMVGFSATILRALIMSLIAILAEYFGRQNEALRALFLAAFLMLLWNPLTLQDPSFQLSFMATLGLLLFTPAFLVLISDRLPIIPEKFGLREITASTFAVQLFILPLLIKISGIFSPISFLANLIVLPIVPLVMFFGFLTALLGFISPVFSWPFGAASYLLTEFIIKIVELSSKIPAIKISSLSTIAITTWYLIYAYLFLRFRKILLDHRPV